MNNIFCSLIVEGVVYVYLNNILIFTQTLEEHCCKFEQTQVEHLGLIILHGIAEIELVKVAGVADWLMPQNKKEVQSFLGFTNFYQPL